MRPRRRQRDDLTGELAVAVLGVLLGLIMLILQ
jgi:hypothetical protein